MDDIDSVRLAGRNETEKEGNERHLFLGVDGGVDLGTETDGVRSFEIGDGYYYGEHKIGPGDSRFMELGFVGGFEFEYRLNHFFALRGSLLYDQKGVGMNYTYTTETSPTPIAHDTEDIMLNYLEIPLLVKWNLSVGDAGMFLFAGPSFGFLLSGKMQNHPIIRNVSGNSMDLFQSNMPSISAIAGVGFNFNFGPNILGEINASYTYGLTNDSFGQVPYSEIILYSAESRDIRLAAGILFPLD